MNPNVLLNQQQQQLANEIEIEMLQDFYSRMTNACHKKCIPPKYNETDLSKGESICIDRCVAKYFDIQDRVGKKLAEISTQQFQAAQPGAAPPADKK